MSEYSAADAGSTLGSGPVNHCTAGSYCLARVELNLLTRRLGHDLGAPLRAIGTLPQWIREEFESAGTPIAPKAADYLTMIERRATRMDNFLVGILEFSKIASAAGQLSPIDAKSEIDSALRDLIPEGTFTTEIAPDITDLQMARPDFTALVRHLVTNAVRHNDSQICHIQVRAMRRDADVIFEVQDNGPGIRPKDRRRIFEPFVTLKPRDQVEGSGLGLATVEKIISHYGGTVSVSDAPERGSVFRCRLPIISASKFTSNSPP